MEGDEIDVYYLGSEEVNGNPAHVLNITGSDGSTSRLFLSADTGLPVKQQFRGTGLTGPAEIEAFYSDYRDVDGIQVPFKREVLADGQKQREVTITTVQVDVEVDAAVFQKP